LNTNQEFRHKPIMLDEVIEGLCVRPDGTYVDGTLGGAGHSFEVASRLGADGRLIGIDQDKDAIETATRRLEPLRDRTNIHIVKSNYVNMPEILSDLGVDKVSGILLDLGVSSYQLDNFKRGFSYREDAPLDMRMDQDSPTTAADIVNDYDEHELMRIIRDYGEEPFAKSIAANIARYREKKRIETTFELNEIISKSIPASRKRAKGHPSKQTFQAIRIELNGELSVLEDSLERMIELLEPKGRICIITFHSLEDRIVKNCFKTAENPCICPPEFPVCVCGRVSKGRVITRKPIVSSQAELEDNPRAKSAKLRVFEKAGERL